MFGPVSLVYVYRETDYNWKQAWGKTAILTLFSLLLWPHFEIAEGFISSSHY